MVAFGQQGQSLNMGEFSLVGAVPEHTANHGELSCNCVCFVHTNDMLLNFLLCGADPSCQKKKRKEKYYTLNITLLRHSTTPITL